MLFAKLLETDTTGLYYPFLKLENLGLTRIKHYLETWYSAQRMGLHPCLVSRMALLLM